MTGALSEDIATLSESPFPELRRCLEFAAQNPDHQYKDAMDAYKDNLIENIIMALFNNDVKKIFQRLDHPANLVGIRRLAGTATQYSNRMVGIQSLDSPLGRLCVEAIFLNLDRTGISALQQQLVSLASSKSRQDLIVHVLERLSYVSDEGERVLTFHQYNQLFHSLCDDLSRSVHALQIQLNDAVGIALYNFAKFPWDPFYGLEIEKRFKTESETWKKPQICSRTFNRMLNNYGIDISRRLNLNKRLLNQYKSCMDGWRDDTLKDISRFQIAVLKPFRDYILWVEMRINTSHVQVTSRDLAQRALVEVRKVSGRINQAGDRFRDRLEASIWDIYRRYSTESVISDPIATLMNPHYLEVWRARNVGSGQHSTQPGAVIHLVNHPGRWSSSLAKTVCDCVQVSQVRAWKADCESFGNLAMKLISSLPRNMAMLLDDGRIQTNERIQLHQFMAQQLQGFDIELQQLCAELGI